MNILQFLLAFVLLGSAATLAYMGQDVLRKALAPSPALSPQQEKLLRIIYAHQVRLGMRKLVVGRDGFVFDDAAGAHVPDTNLAKELLGDDGDASARRREFEIVMESLPELYLRKWSETRFDNPFVVAVTDDGVRYLSQER